MLRQERFQDALRKRLDFRDVRDARTRNRCQTMSVPRRNNRLVTGGGVGEGREIFFVVTRLVRVTPVDSTSWTYLSTSLTGSTGALHEMKITARMWGKKLSSEKKRSSAA